MKKKILVLIIVIFLSFIIGITFFMINNGWYLRIFKNTYTKEIDGKVDKVLVKELIKESYKLTK